MDELTIHIKRDKETGLNTVVVYPEGSEAGFAWTVRGQTDTMVYGEVITDVNDFLSSAKKD
jgi:hypothetical protein